jgi:hypothetical protein
MLSFSKNFLLMYAPFYSYTFELLFVGLESRHHFWHLGLLPFMDKILPRDNQCPNHEKLPLSPHANFVLALDVLPSFQIDLTCPNIGSSSSLETLIGGPGCSSPHLERVLIVEFPVVVDSNEEVVDYVFSFADFEGKTPSALVATHVSPSFPNRASGRGSPFTL